MLNKDEELTGLFGRLHVEEGEPKVLPLPLKGVHVKADVHDFIAEVKITQCYQNIDTVNPVECIYHFPIDQAAAVCGLKAEYEDGTVINGVVKEKEEAAKEYQKVIKDGKQANLLQSLKRDIFTLNVGNLPPGSYVKITIVYITTLEARDSAVALVLPTSIAPRYVPSTDIDEVSSIEFAAAASPKTTNAKLFGLDISVEFTCKSTIKTITSPTHKEASCISQGIKGYFNIRDIALSRDVVVLCQEENAHQPRVSVEIGDDGSMVGFVSIFPEIEFPDVAREFVFLLDRSGSMSTNAYNKVAQKTQIDQAKEALLLFLRALPPNSTFNVVSFGSNYETMFDSPQPYNDQTLDYASSRVKSMQADLGGTEILKPLKFIFESTNLPGTERQVFILTDGEVYNDQAIFELIQNNCSRSLYSGRLFCVGVGANVSRHLCTGMARHGRGTVRFVEEGDSIALHSKLMGQLKQALQPALDQVTIDWGTPQRFDDTTNKTLESCKPDPPGVKSLLGYRSPEIDEKVAFKPKEHNGIRVLPSRIPPIFNKERFLSYALFPRGCGVPNQVTVSCQTQDGPLKLVLEVKDQDIFHGSIAHKMAARVAISEFEDYRQNDNGGMISRSEALDMALKNNLGSALTSFLAVSEKSMIDSGSSTPIVNIPQYYQYDHPNRLDNQLVFYDRDVDACFVPYSCCDFDDDWNYDRMNGMGPGLVYSNRLDNQSINLDEGSIGNLPCRRYSGASFFSTDMAMTDDFDCASAVDLFGYGDNEDCTDWDKDNMVHCSVKSQCLMLEVACDSSIASKSEKKDPEAKSYGKDNSGTAFYTDGTKTSQVSPFNLCILQKANGSFVSIKQIANAIGISEDLLNKIGQTLQSEKPTNNDKKDQEQNDVAFATILAIAAFRFLFAKEKAVWELHEGKALAYLANTIGDCIDIEERVSIVQSKL